MSIKQEMEGLSKSNREKFIADLLGISHDDLQKLSYEIEETDEEEGITVTFDIEGSDPEVLEQLEGLDSSYSIQLN